MWIAVALACAVSAAPPDPVTAPLAAAGGAMAGGALGAGVMMAALLATSAAETPEAPTAELFAGNAALTVLSLGLPVLFTVGGGAGAGIVTGGVVVALTSGFGATVGAAVGAGIGGWAGSLLPLSAVDDGAARLLPVAVYGGLAASLGALGAGLGALGGVLSSPPEESVSFSS